MAGMNDPLTEAPPPSRLDLDDLSLFHSPLIPLHPPFTAWSSPSPSVPLRPALLFVATSAAASHLVHNVPGTRILGSVVLPELSMSGNTILPSLTDNACYLYALGDSSNGNAVILASVQYVVTPERARALAKQLLRDIAPAQVLTVGSLSLENFRGQSHTNNYIDLQPLIFRLETDLLRLEDHTSLAIPYLPSGSLADGICAAILTECQMRGIKGRLLLTLPENDSSLIPSLVATLSTLIKTTPGAKILDFSSALKAPFRTKTVADSDLYI